MRISSNEKAKFAFSAALILLFLSGIGASLTIIRLYLTEGWVRHTYTVEVGLGDLESSLAAAGRNRAAYVESGSADSLREFWVAVSQVQRDIAGIRALTSDNPTEESLRGRLEANADQRLVPSFKAIQMKQENRSDPADQTKLTIEVTAAAMETTAIARQMKLHEDGLLAQRSQLSKRLFSITVYILAFTFVLSALMFWIHYRLLNDELRIRVAAEDQLRQLSVQLMKVRDEEARKFARELHDGLGQSLVAAKLTADSLQTGRPENSKLKDLCSILHDCVSQTRTISYLLHPPMLDEMGFGAAAQWFIEGYSQRTGVALSCSISREADHLPRQLQLTLFRILQEALTNIHRHSKSRRADVSVSLTSEKVILVVRDHGCGVPSEVLANFKAKGTHVGVGLAGMKERIRELHGEFEIRSDSTGTQITVLAPIMPPATLTAAKVRDARLSSAVLAS
jgi:signal transduction histidine kinase